MMTYNIILCLMSYECYDLWVGVRMLNNNIVMYT